MPEMDGFELARAVRKEEQQRGMVRTPIVALTADVLPKTEADCMAAGMDAYLRKPFEMPKLIEALEIWNPKAQHLRRPPASKPRLSQPVSERDGDLALRKNAAPEPVVDRSVLAGLLASDAGADHVDALLRFWDACGNGPEELREALATGVSKSVREAAHALKGAAATIGARSLAAALSKLETAARTGDLSGAAHCLAEVRVDFARVCVHIDAMRVAESPSSAALKV